MLALALAAGGYATKPARAALLLTGTTRDQVTAPNPDVDGFAGSMSVTLDGESSPYNQNVTHAWGPYYFIGKHQMLDGVAFQNIYLGPDYVGDPSPPIGITRIDLCPFADFAIITADKSVDVPRSPGTRLVGVADAQKVERRPLARRSTCDWPIRASSRSSTK
jgi:hypothetical protein